MSGKKLTLSEFKKGGFSYIKFMELSEEERKEAEWMLELEIEDNKGEINQHQGPIEDAQLQNNLLELNNRIDAANKAKYNPDGSIKTNYDLILQRNKPKRRII